MVSYCRANDRALLSKPSISELVRVLGDVPYKQVAGVYRGHDLPVVAANLAYAREVCGEAALYFDPPKS